MMVREICRDEGFLAQKARACHVGRPWTRRGTCWTRCSRTRTGCVGMAANMIGVNKRIIAFDNEGHYMVMFNPVIVKQSGPYEAEEGCLSLTGTAEDQAVPDPSRCSWQNEKFQEPAEDLHRLDGGDHPARDRPLRGHPDMIFWFYRHREQPVCSRSAWRKRWTSALLMHERPHQGRRHRSPVEIRRAPWSSSRRPTRGAFPASSAIWLLQKRSFPGARGRRGSS